MHVHMYVNVCIHVCVCIYDHILKKQVQLLGNFPSHMSEIKNCQKTEVISSHEINFRIVYLTHNLVCVKLKI